MTSLHDDFFTTHLTDAPVMAIFRGLSPEATVQRARDAWATGARLVEVPVQDEAGWAAFAAVRDAAGDRPVGVGTVLTADQLRRAADAGAAFSVAPGLDLELGALAAELGIAHLPGVGTGTEVGRALAAGHHWLKAFPASVLGAEWVRAMRGPFPDARFVCTGGMNFENWPTFRAAGAHAVAIGSGWA